MNRFAAHTTHPWYRNAIALQGFYVLLCLALDRLSYVRPQLVLGITPWSPQTGLAVAFLVYMGWRGVPAVVIAAFLGEVLLHAGAVPGPELLLGAVWLGMSYGALAAWLRRMRLTTAISSTIDAARMAGACAIGTLLISIGYVGLFVATGDVRGSEAVGGIARSWVGDLNGVLSLTPLLLGLADQRPLWRTFRARRREIFAQAAALALTILGIFLLPATDQLRFFFLLFVPVIWIALRWSWQGAMLAVLGIQIGLLVAAETRIPTARFIDLQFLMLTLSLTGLLLGTVVAERAGALRRMAVREAEQRALLAMAPDAVLDVDSGGRVREANAVALRMFGAGARGMVVTELLPGLGFAMREGRATLAGRSEEGSDFPAEVAWARLDAPANEGFLVIVRDASERHLAQRQLRERDAALARGMRFAVAGELASALAHELNQPITALVSYLRASEILAERASAADDRLASTLGKAVREAIRASEVLRRLRDFYQSGTRQSELLHLPLLCEEVIGAFQDRVRRLEVNLSADIDPAMPALHVDRTQMEIVLHNLIGNALDAVSQQPVDLRHVIVRGSYAADAITLRVEDSGPGVEAEVVHRLFEPFVTSKADGMGLGLAIARSLVRARGGDLSLATDGELAGAAFVVWIPVQVPGEVAVV